MPCNPDLRQIRFYPFRGGAMDTRNAAVLLAALVLGNCATLGKATGQTEATLAAAQSETAATTSSAGIVVSFNDETGNGNKIVYGATSRKISKGASLLGWSYSAD